MGREQVPGGVRYRAELEKKAYQPGEKGKLVATFTVAHRQGLHAKQITVTTDDPSESTTILRMTIELPPLVSISPGYVYWQPNEEPAAKTIEVKVTSPQPIRRNACLPTCPGCPRAARW